MSTSNKSKSNSAEQNGQKKPDATDEILEQIELLIEQEQGDKSVYDISEKLESDVEKRSDAIEEKTALAESDQNDAREKFDSSLSKLIDRFDAIESKLASIEDKIQDANRNQLSASKIQARFEAFDTRFEKIMTAIAGQQQLIENRTTSVDVSDINSLREQFMEMLGQVKSELAAVPASSDQQEEEDSKDTKETSASETDWIAQKQAVLSKYGIDPQHRPSMDAPSTENDPVLETTVADGKLGTSIDSEAKEEIPTDPKDIKRVTKEMNRKLRDAEVELSIERAKLSQLQAELESKQIELDRRDLELTKKSNKRGSSKNSSREEDQDEGLLDRLKKHLTAKDRTNLDRI